MSKLKKLSIITGIISALFWFVGSVAGNLGYPWSTNIIEIGGMFATFVNMVFAVITGTKSNNGGDDNIA